MIERDEVFRVKTLRKTGTLARVLDAIARHGAHAGEIETLKITPDYNIREIVVIAPSDDAIGPITESIRAVDGVELVADPVDRVFSRHRSGKLNVVPSVEIRILQDMREIYTPGVARVSKAIVMTQADILVMTTGQPNLMKPEWVRRGHMIMALSNPIPEIDRRDALAAGAALATDGAIVNNVLAYPGLFRGALDAGASRISGNMKRIAAETLGDLAPRDELFPDPLDRAVDQRVATAVTSAATQ